MNKFILRIALFLGLLVGFTSPALAQKAGYATMDLTLKVSEYTGTAGGQVGVSPVRNPETFTGGWHDECSVHIDASEAQYRGETVYNDVSIFAKAKPGYVFSYWAESDKKSSKPDKASFGKEITLWVNILGCYTKYMLAENPGTTPDYADGGYAAKFRYHVYGTFLDKHNSARTLFAVFEPATYTVTFEANGGSVSPTSKEVKYKTIYGALPTPTKPGFVFGGWYLDEACTDTPVSANTSCTTASNHNLYAKWTAYTISFVDQESGVSRSLPNQSYTDAGMPNLAASTYKLSWGDRTDKYFAGYYTQPNGLGIRVYKGVVDGSTLAKGAAFVPTSNVTLYAHYSHTHHNMYWDYTYDMGWSEGHPSGEYHNLAEDDTENRIKYARLTFKRADGTTIKQIVMTAIDVHNSASPAQAFSTHTKALANIHLHVGVSPDVLNVEDVDVYFTDDELASFASYTFEAISATNPNPALATPAALWMVTTDKANHNTILTYTGASLHSDNVFDQAWSVKLSGLLINPDVIYVMPLFENTSGSWEAISQLAHTTGVTCAKVSEEGGVATYNGSYPIWKKNATGTFYNNAIGLVGFNLGGKDYFMNTENPGEFESFYNSALYNTTTPIVANPGTNTGEHIDVVINMTVPATKIPVIHFLPNGGELSPATPQYLVSAYDATVNLLKSSDPLVYNYSATREGYSFQGWKEDATEGGDDVTSLTMNQAYTLYAQWRSLGYQVTIHMNGGDDDDKQFYVPYLANMPTLSPLPARTGYIFTGCWDIHDYRYYNADGTSHQPYNKMEDSELWAGWTPKTYTVILDPNDAMAITDTITATYDHTLPNVVAPSNSAFLGYFDARTGGNMYIDASGNGVRLWDKTDDEVTTLYAHWNTGDFYPVTYHANHTYAGGNATRIRYFAKADPEDPKVQNKWVAGAYAGMTIPADKRRFVGWTESSDGTGKLYLEDTAIDPTSGTLELYAKWADNPTNGYTLWYGKGDFSTRDWKYLEFTQSKSGDHHVWESGHLEITEDMKIQDDAAREIFYFVVAGGLETTPTQDDINRKMVMGKMGVAPCHEEDGTCLRTVHDLLLPEDGGHPEESDRAGVYGHFHIWTSHTAECNFACHMVRDFFLDYHSNFPFGLPDRTYEQIVEFETGHTIIKGNEYHMDDFPQGLLTFRNWNTKPDGTGTTYHQGDIFTFPADSTHNIRLYAQWEIDETQAEHFVVHQTGSHYGTLLDNGMQRVHTYERTIYINEGDNLQLYRPDYSTYREYVRWYNFNTDHACPNLWFKDGYFGASRNFQNQQGRFFTNQNNQGEVRFNAPADFNTNSNYQNGIDVACDQSAYTDGRFLSFGFQYSRMVWYFFEFDVDNTADPGNQTTCNWTNPRKLTKADLDAMQAGTVKYIYIVKPNNGGFVWFWNNAHNGATINPISESGIVAKVEECRTAGNQNGYRMKLTKRADGGITIRTLSTQGSSHSGDYLSITEDKHFTFANTYKDSVWYYSNPGRDINETNLGSIDGTRNNTSLLYLRNVEDDYLYTDALPNDHRLWKGVEGSVAANLPSGTNTVGNTEPTLSQRLLFHIKPATIMADSMKKYISKYDKDNGSGRPIDLTIMREPYMEEQYMIVPTGQTFWAGPSLQYIQGSDNSFPYHQHTYCFYDNEAGTGTPTMCKQGDTGYWQWKVNGKNYSNPTVATGRFARFEASDEVRNDTLTLQFFPMDGRAMGRKAYNVCRIVVEYMNKAVVGPSHELGYGAVATAMRVAYEDFNINPRTGRFVGNSETHDFNGTKVRFYTRALPYEESAYGFYDGSRTIAHYAGGGRRWFPFWGEYGLVSNSATGWGVNNVVANHDESVTLYGQNPETGYSIYIDGSAIPGEVFELNVDNLKLCANSKMYCSAWVASVTQSPHTKPNFDFEVFAYNKVTGQEHVVTTYTTGELDYNPVGAAPYAWKHILFPVTYRGEVGAVGEGNVQFRVRVINKGKNSAGNDFMIDDIAFFVKQPDFKAIQANTTSCLQTGQEERMPLYLRVDYEQLIADEPDEDHAYYYAWFNSEHESVVATDGYFWLDGELPTSEETAAGANTTKMGKINLSASLDGKPTYNSFKEFDQHITQQLTAGTLRAQRAYVKETGKDGRERFFLYIVQPLTVKANHTYHAAMSTDINNVVAGHSHEDPCTMVTHLDIIAGARIRVDGEVFTHESDICGNRTYTLDVEMNYIIRNQTTGQYENKTIYCNADWLKGCRDTIIAHKDWYGVSGYATADAAYDAVVKAVIAHHTAEEAENVVNDAEYERIYQVLLGNGLLTTNVSKFVFHPTSSDSHYMAFARGDGSSEHAHICPEPQDVFFKFPENYKHGVIIGNATENAPLSVIEKPRVIRVQHNIIKYTGMFSFPLYQAVGEDQSALDGFVITAAESIERNASGMPQYVLSAKTVSNDGHRTNVGSVPADGCIVELTGDCLKDIEDGEYNFALLMEVPSTLEENACDIRYAYFKLIVTPDILNWNPTVSVWNADDAWTDADNDKLHYVPLPTTQVIMPDVAKTVPLPIKADTIESGAQDHIVFDIYGDTESDNDFYYRPYSCSDIYFPVGASLMNQSTLKIGGQAFIDVAYTANKWQLTSFPIQGVVSGDIFIPKDGDNPGTTHPFEIKKINQTDGNVADRTTYPFYQNLYNTSVMNTTGSGSCQEEVQSSTWLTNTEYDKTIHTSGRTANGLAIPYGYEVGNQAAAAFYLKSESDASVRLPKEADVTYKYYDKNTKQWIGYLSDEVHRSSNYAKPLYTESSQTFTLRGTNASNIFLFGNPTFAYIDMAKFMEVNAGVLSGKYYRLLKSNYVTNLGHVGADASTGYYLPPYSAVLVETANPTTPATATEVTVTVSDAMLVAAPSQAQASAPGRQSSISNHQSSTIFMSATSDDFTTYAMVEEDPTATNHYDENEDADVFLMAPAQTPFVLYTGIDGHAMAINRHQSLDYLPLSIFTQIEDAPVKAKVTIAFTGDDAYVSEWDLMLLSTGKLYPLSNNKKYALSMYTDGTPAAALVHTRAHRVTTAIADESSEALHVYAHGGHVYCCADRDMHRIEVLSPAGQLVCTANEVGTYHEFNLAPGVYLVRVDGKVFKVFND